MKILSPDDLAYILQRASSVELEDVHEDEKPRHNWATGLPLDEVPPPGYEEIWLAMGCFWCAEARLSQVEGVRTTAVGYCGGRGKTTYNAVCHGHTGHAEAVRVVYESQALTAVLKTFWESHDPTTRDAQGGDVGSQYRSAIWYHTPRQRNACERSREAYAAALTDAGIFDPIVTHIRTAHGLDFHYAEKEHQQYDARPNTQPYSGLAPIGVLFPASFDISDE